ncbi:MAG: DNA replication and repair protein RecF [Bacteroidia bacterium]
MYLQNLSVLNFRNYEACELSFSERVNCFTGLNGSGKTNLLDAIHYLSLCKSFLNPTDSQNIRHDAPFFVIQGTFDHGNEVQDAVYCGVKRGQRKTFKRNSKEYERLSDHIGLFPLVVVSPADGVLITGGSEERRRFMDTVISQYNRNYLDQLIAYNKVLSQRNSLLKLMAEGKAGNDGTLEILNLQLCQYGEPVHIARRAFIKELLPFFNKFYNDLSGGAEEVGLIYESKLLETSLNDLLESALQKDKILQHTTVGIHKDDLDFTIGDYSLRKSGSQGQQKTFLIALKLAEYVFLDRASGKKPMLLLDDIHDKLDEERVGRLMDIVCSNDFGQLFITDTGAGRMSGMFEGRGVPYKMFNVEQGMVSEA